MGDTENNKVSKEIMDNTEGFSPDMEIKMDEILDKGLKGREGFFSYLKAVKRELGFKYIFHDKSELIFIVLLLALASSFFGLQFNKIDSKEIEFIYRLKAFTIGTSPIIYFTICSYGFISSRMNGIYELQATSKYNFYNLTAIRMFIFSIVSMAVNTLIIVMMYLIKRNFNAVEIITLSMSALFIFSTVYILILIKLNNRRYKYLLILLWLVVTIIMGFQFDGQFMRILDNISWYMHLIITFVALVIYMKSLKRLIKVKRGEV